MATGGDIALTDQEIEELSKNIVAIHLESIAISHLGISSEIVENFKLAKQGDLIAFNRDLLVLWRNKNHGINQTQVCTFIFRFAELLGIDTKFIIQTTLM